MLILTSLESATEIRQHWINQIKYDGVEAPPTDVVTQQLDVLRQHLNLGSLSAAERLVLSTAATVQPIRSLWTKAMPFLAYAEAYLEMLEVGFRSLAALSTMELDETLLRAARRELEASTARAGLCLALDAQTIQALLKQNSNFDEFELQQIADIYDTCFTERCLAWLTGVAILLLSWLRFHHQHFLPADDTFKAAALEGSLSSIHAIPSPQAASKRLLTLLTHAIRDLDDDMLCELMHVPFFGTMDGMATEDEWPGVTIWDLVSSAMPLDLAVTHVIAEAQLSLSHPNLSMRCRVFVLEGTALDSARRIQSSLPARPVVKRRRHTIASPRTFVRPHLDLSRHLDVGSLHHTQIPALRLATWRHWTGGASNAPPARRSLLLAALGLLLVDSQWMHLHNLQVGGGLYPVALYSLHHLLTAWPNDQKKTLHAICDAFGNLMTTKIKELRHVPIPGAPGLQERLVRLMNDSHSISAMRDAASYDHLTTLFKARGGSM